MIEGCHWPPQLCIFICRLHVHLCASISINMFVRQHVPPRTGRNPPAPACQGPPGCEAKLASHCYTVLVSCIQYQLPVCKSGILSNGCWRVSQLGLVTCNRAPDVTFNLPLTFLPRFWDGPRIHQNVNPYPGPSQTTKMPPKVPQKLPKLRPKASLGTPKSPISQKART